LGIGDWAQSPIPKNFFFTYILANKFEKNKIKIIIL